MAENSSLKRSYASRRERSDEIGSGTFQEKNKLGKRLREFRRRNHLTQRQVAEKLHMDRSTYAYYEIGKTAPGIRTLMLLPSLYGVSIDRMVGNGAKKGSGF